MADRRRFLLYTTEQGGMFKFANAGQFDLARATGALDVTPNDRDPDEPRDLVKPAYIALVETVDDYDFRLERAR